MANAWDVAWGEYIAATKALGSNHPVTVTARERARAVWMADGSPEPMWYREANKKRA